MNLQGVEDNFELDSLKCIIEANMIIIHKTAQGLIPFARSPELMLGIETISKQCMSAYNKLNKLVDYVSLTSGSKSPCMQSVDIIDMLNSITENAGSFFTHNVNYCFEFDSELNSKYIKLDEDIMERVIYNLINIILRKSEESERTKIIISVSEEINKIDIIIRKAEQKSQNGSRSKKVASDLATEEDDMSYRISQRHIEHMSGELTYRLKYGQPILFKISFKSPITAKCRSVSMDRFRPNMILMESILGKYCSTD